MSFDTIFGQHMQKCCAERYIKFRLKEKDTRVLGVTSPPNKIVLLPRLPDRLNACRLVLRVVVVASLAAMVFPFVFHMVAIGNNAYQVVYQGERLVLPW